MQLHVQEPLFKIFYTFISSCQLKIFLQMLALDFSYICPQFSWELFLGKL